MSELTGLSASTITDIWANVKRNSRALAECGGHEFSPILPPVTALNQRYRCMNCGGEINSSAHHWFEIGRRQGTP